MKIALVNSLYPPNQQGGAELSVQFLAESLASTNEVIVISSHKEQEQIVLQNRGVKAYYLGIRNFYWPFAKEDQISLLKPAWHLLDIYNPWMAGEVKKILAQEKPDLVHTNNLLAFSGAVWPLARRLNLPIVHTLRDYYLLCPKSSMYRNGRNCNPQCLDCRLYAKPKTGLSNLVNAVVGNSSFILERHLQAGFFRRTQIREVIYNLFQAEENFRHARNADGRLTLGYLGRLDESKGIGYLLETIADLPDQDVQLLVAGESNDPKYETYLKETHSRSNIHFLGYSNREQFFAQLDLLVVPSLWHDPLPRTIYEAFAYGVPVIASTRGGIPEIVEEGVTGYLFDPDLPASLPHIIRRIIRERTEISTMRTACLHSAKTFSSARILGQYNELYARVLQ